EKPKRFSCHSTFACALLTCVLPSTLVGARKPSGFLGHVKDHLNRLGGGADPVDNPPLRKWPCGPGFVFSKRRQMAVGAGKPVRCKLVGDHYRVLRRTQRKTRPGEQRVAGDGQRGVGSGG